MRRTIFAMSVANQSVSFLLHRADCTWSHDHLIRGHAASSAIKILNTRLMRLTGCKLWRRLYLQKCSYPGKGPRCAVKARRLRYM